MDKYWVNSDYREKVEAAWDKHKYLYDNEARTNLERANRED